MHAQSKTPALKCFDRALAIGKVVSLLIVELESGM